MNWRLLYVVIVSCVYTVIHPNTLRAQTADDSTNNIAINHTATSNTEDLNLTPIDTSAYRLIDSHAINNYKRDKNFIYSYEQPSKSKQPLFDLRALASIWKNKTIIYSLYCLVALVVLYILFMIFKQSDFTWHIRRKQNVSKSSADWESVEHFNQWEDAIEQAIQQENFRLATRIMYLELLQLLHMAKLIVYEKEKTNWNYVTALGSTTFGPPFAQITRYFDYIWYGEFTVTPSIFKDIQQLHTQLKQSIHL